MMSHYGVSPPPASAEGRMLFTVAGGEADSFPDDPAQHPRRFMPADTHEGSNSDPDASAFSHVDSTRRRRSGASRSDADSTRVHLGHRRIHIHGHPSSSAAEGNGARTSPLTGGGFPSAQVPNTSAFPAVAGGDGGLVAGENNSPDVTRRCFQHVHHASIDACGSTTTSRLEATPCGATSVTFQSSLGGNATSPSATWGGACAATTMAATSRTTASGNFAATGTIQVLSMTSTSNLSNASGDAAGHRALVSATAMSVHTNGRQWTGAGHLACLHQLPSPTHGAGSLFFSPSDTAVAGAHASSGGSHRFPTTRHVDPRGSSSLHEKQQHGTAAAAEEGMGNARSSHANSVSDVLGSGVLRDSTTRSLTLTTSTSVLLDEDAVFELSHEQQRRHQHPFLSPVQPTPGHGKEDSDRSDAHTSRPSVSPAVSCDVVRFPSPVGSRHGHGQAEEDDEDAYDLAAQERVVRVLAAARAVEEEAEEDKDGWESEAPTSAGADSLPTHGSPPVHRVTPRASSSVATTSSSHHTLLHNSAPSVSGSQSHNHDSHGDLLEVFRSAIRTIGANSLESGHRPEERPLSSLYEACQENRRSLEGRADISEGARGSVFTSHVPSRKASFSRGRGPVRGADVAAAPPPPAPPLPFPPPPPPPQQQQLDIPRDSPLCRLSATVTAASAIPLSATAPVVSLPNPHGGRSARPTPTELMSNPLGESEVYHTNEARGPGEAAGQRPTHANHSPLASRTAPWEAVSSLHPPVAQPPPQRYATHELESAVHTYHDDAATLHGRVDADGCLVVVDPQRRKIKVPVATIERTKALSGRLTTPSLCLLFQSGRCRQGANCYQVHAEPEVVRRLRREAELLPCCCAAHGDGNEGLWEEHHGPVSAGRGGLSASEEAFREFFHRFKEQLVIMVTTPAVGGGVGATGAVASGGPRFPIPLKRTAYTVGLDRVLQAHYNNTNAITVHPEPGGVGLPFASGGGADKESSVTTDPPHRCDDHHHHRQSTSASVATLTVSATALCRLHGQREGCRFGADCKFLHICRSLLQTELAPLMAAMNAAAAATPAGKGQIPHATPTPLQRSLLSPAHTNASVASMNSTLTGSNATITITNSSASRPFLLLSNPNAALASTGSSFSTSLNASHTGNVGIGGAGGGGGSNAGSASYTLAPSACGANGLPSTPPAAFFNGPPQPQQQQQQHMALPAEQMFSFSGGALRASPVAGSSLPARSAPSQPLGPPPPPPSAVVCEGDRYVLGIGAGGDGSSPTVQQAYQPQGQFIFLSSPSQQQHQPLPQQSRPAAQFFSVVSHASPQPQAPPQQQQQYSSPYILPLTTPGSAAGRHDAGPSNSSGVSGGGKADVGGLALPHSHLASQAISLTGTAAPTHIVYNLTSGGSEAGAARASGIFMQTMSSDGNVTLVPLSAVLAQRGATGQ